MKIRVTIADDHPLVRDGLRFVLDRDGQGVDVIGEAADGMELLRLARQSPADVYIVDITMPRLNGLDAARDLLRANPEAKIIILSFHTSQALVEQAMDLGVRGYVSKESASERIGEAVRLVASGRFYLSPDVTHVMVERGLGVPSRSAPARRTAGLTPQERKVLQLISEGKSAKEIAATLGRSVHTIHAHRKSLMRKLDVHKQTDLVRLAVREGIAKL